MSTDPSGVGRRNIMRADAFRKLKNGDANAASLAFEAVISADSQDVVALCGLGSARESLGDQKGAVTAYQHALTIEPGNFDALHRMGRLLIANGRPGRAVTVLEQAVARKSGSDSAWCDLGSAQIEMRRLNEAEESLRRAVNLNPRLLVAHHNLGICLRYLGRLDESVQTFQNALKINPNMGSTVAACAATLSDRLDIDDAIELLDHFLKRHPENAECHQNKALILLRAGDLREGLESYEWRLVPASITVSLRPFPQPRWLGETLRKETLLVWLEQGIGDEILALSMAADILERVPNCSFECDPRLVTILERSFPSARIIPRSDPPHQETKRADLVCPALSAARYLRQSFDDFPNHHGYLETDLVRTKEIRKRYQSLSKGRKIVGLSWGSASRGGHMKTPPLEIWNSLLTNDEVFFVSLQYAGAKEDTKAFFELSGTQIYIDPNIDTINDIDKSASQLTALDAIISISNSTAHLAGALGKPVATLVPEGHGGFWYWFRDRSESPWYPSMYLCRQATQGDWSSAIASAQEWLLQHIDG